MKENTLKTKNAEYVMRLGNATDAWDALKTACKLLKNVDLNSVEQVSNVQAEAALQIIANIGDPAIANIERIVYENTTVKKNGEVYRLIDRFDEHFNECRGDMIPLLMAGVKFHFGDFFSAGLKSLTTMMR